MLKVFLLLVLAFASFGAVPVDLELDSEDEFLTAEARGLLSKETKEQIKDCLGSLRNKFLTKISSKEQFVDCIDSACESDFSGVMDQLIACVGLEKGTKGKGKGKMIMANRGRLGFCIRETETKC